MVIDIKPSFSQALSHLNNLFDVVMNYDEATEKKILTTTHQSIQTTISLAMNSTLDSERVSTEYLNLYEGDLSALTRDVGAQEDQLRSHQSELFRLTDQRSKWQSEVTRFEYEIADLEAKVRHADQLAQSAQARVVRKRRNRWKWITATVITGGNLYI